MQLINILRKEKINYDKNSIKYCNFDKIILFGKYNKLQCFVKIFVNKKTFKFFYNEIDGYLFFKKKRIFKLPKIYKFIDKKNYKIIIFEKIVKKKKKFKLFKKISFDKLKSKEKKFSELDFLNCNQFLKLNLNNYCKNCKDYKILLKPSHGDFSHYNVLKGYKNDYLIDFEYFSKNRSFFHDDLNWYISLIINFIYNKNFSNINLISFFMYFVLNLIMLFLFFKKFHQISLKQINVYILIFILEKIKISYQDIYINKTNRFNKFKVKLYLRLINIFLKKI